MDHKIIKASLPYRDQETQALLFLPQHTEPQQRLAVFSHGYTSHKGDLLSWGNRLAEEGLASIIFDWPGHYLGNYSEVTDLDQFQTSAHRLFFEAFSVLRKNWEELYGDSFNQNSPIVLGGHSLGALLSLYAMTLPEFSDYKISAVCVGLGITPEGEEHLFQSKFFEKTMEVRQQLVSPALHPKNFLPLINKLKLELPKLSGPVHLITGENDVIVGKNGSERLLSLLESAGNKVSLEKPKNLSHHQPELAATTIRNFLRL
ncbi:MAG: alpha/beta fold hydrolase [Halobacteriovoraceae bacterium]|nr:alpha/beta fold hydrolase [Halobacteriovoraceae bacterium]